MPLITNPSILRGVLSADRASTIGRGVVGDYQLEIGKGLRNQGVECFSDERLSVVHRHANTDFRLVLRLGSCSWVVGYFNIQEQSPAGSVGLSSLFAIGGALLARRRAAG